MSRVRAFAFVACLISSGATCAASAALLDAMDLPPVQVSVDAGNSETLHSPSGWQMNAWGKASVQRKALEPVQISTEGEASGLNLSREVDARAFASKWLRLRVETQVLEGSPDAVVYFTSLKRPDTALLAVSNFVGNQVVCQGKPVCAREFVFHLPVDAGEVMVALSVAGTGRLAVRRWVVESVDEPAPARGEAADYLRRAIGDMRGLSVRRHEIDWTRMEDEALRHLPPVASLDDAHSVLARVLAGLKDGHSHLRTPSSAAASVGREAAPLSSVEVRQGLGIITLHSAMLGAQAEVDREANALRQRVLAAWPDVDKGWLLDLRPHGGGNMWPGIAGLQPLFDTDRAVSAFVTPSGQAFEWWADCGGAGVEHAGTRPVHARVACDPIPTTPRRPVVVLVGPRTGSAGEMIAIAFIGQAVLLGDTTAGYATPNEVVTLSDGAMMAVTTGWARDRCGRRVPVRLTPEVPLAGRDPEVVARELLASGHAPACRPAHTSSGNPT